MLVGAEPRRAVGQIGKPLGIAGIEIGIGKHVFDRGNLRLEMLDLARQAVEVALVLVAQLPASLRREETGSFFLWSRTKLRSRP